MRLHNPRRRIQPLSPQAEEWVGVLLRHRHRSEDLHRQPGFQSPLSRCGQ